MNHSQVIFGATFPARDQAAEVLQPGEEPLHAPTTPLSGLSEMIPGWAGLWFSLFPTVETLVSQFLAGVLVFGSYFTARRLPGMAR